LWKQGTRREGNRHSTVKTPENIPQFPLQKEIQDREIPEIGTAKNIFGWGV